MALTVLTITGSIEYPDGGLASGGLTFVLSLQVAGVWVPTGLVDSSTKQIVTPKPVAGLVYQGKLLSGAAGYPPLTLLAVDDPTTLPVGLAYVVTENLAGGGLPPWEFSPSHSAVGGTVDIGSQRPAP